MELKLRVLEGKHSGQVVSVNGERFFIGRAEDCQMRPGSDLVSRYHCVLLIDDGYVGVRDLGSKNGTYVNGQRITAESELHPGDRLKVGPLEFEVELSTSLGGKKRPAVADVKEAATRVASSTGTADDIDVTQWLAVDPSAPQIQPQETQPMPANTDTGAIEAGSTQEVSLDELSADSGTKPGADKADDSKAKKAPGKLPFQPNRLAAKDSRDAAAQILNLMKKRR